jgi:DNA-binding transcriptional regulator YhcF (GntR family)
MDWVPTISPQAGPLYRQIAEAIEGDIVSGRLRRGQQLPTHRALAKALGIDLTTVHAPMRRLEDAVSSKLGSGRGHSFRNRVSGRRR